MTSVEEEIKPPRVCFENMIHITRASRNTATLTFFSLRFTYPAALVFFCRRVRLAACRDEIRLRSFDGVFLFGSVLAVESAPFKLTAEFVDLMDGPNSACFKGFREVRERDFVCPPQPLGDGVRAVVFFAAFSRVRPSVLFAPAPPCPCALVHVVITRGVTSRAAQLAKEFRFRFLFEIRCFCPWPQRVSILSVTVAVFPLIRT